jgi:hypothetical protein
VTVLDDAGRTGRTARTGLTAPVTGSAGPAAPVADLMRRHDELLRRHRAELRLTAAQAAGGGILGLVTAAAELIPHPLWLLDTRRRVVARSRSSATAGFRPPDLDLLLEQHGPVDLTRDEPILVAARPAIGLARRHLMVPVARDGLLFAWLVVAEVPALLTPTDAAVAHRVAFHLSGEYAVQRRIARASWNARSGLARQLVRGSHRDDDLAAAADYLGVRADADRVLVYVADNRGGERTDERELAERLERELGVEVLSTRGRDGAILLVEAPGDEAPVAYVQHVKAVMRKVVSYDEPGEGRRIVGVSAVTAPGALQRSYRETREVVLCADRFCADGEPVLAVDDLGPARLFVANSDVESVRRYVQDVLGALLCERPGHADLLRTLQCFFDTSRSVRESSVRLGIHENTVRLRLAKVHDLTGLDVAADATDQLSVQTALLVLRLEGHPAIPSFEARREAAAG